jgi:hypothetical protein
MMNESQCNHNISVVFDDLFIRHSGGRSWFLTGSAICLYGEHTYFE